MTRVTYSILFSQANVRSLFLQVRIRYVRHLLVFENTYFLTVSTKPKSITYGYLMVIAKDMAMNLVTMN